MSKKLLGCVKYGSDRGSGYLDPNLFQRSDNSILPARARCWTEAIYFTSFSFTCVLVGWSARTLVSFGLSLSGTPSKHSFHHGKDKLISSPETKIICLFTGHLLILCENKV